MNRVTPEDMDGLGEVKEYQILDTPVAIQVEGKEVSLDPPTNVKEIDPFYYRGKLPWWWWCTVVVVGPVLVPVRLVLLLLVLLIHWTLARIGLAGLSTEKEEQCPLSGWRRTCQKLGFTLLNLVVGCMGVVVRTVGHQATHQEAPVLVVAPHSTLVDWLVCGKAAASPVAKAELGRAWVVGVAARLAQTVWVERGVAASRQATAETIRRRATGTGWTQTLVFPEGTNTNGTTLIRFRTGAFSSGRPVQPVIITFPNTVNTLTWTWDQDRSLASLFLLTLATPIHLAVVEFLPVYRPSAGEQAEPRLYAGRVRRVMAARLGLPTCDLSVEHARGRGAKPGKDSGKVMAKGHMDLSNTSIDVGGGQSAQFVGVSSTSIDFLGNLTVDK